MRQQSPQTNFERKTKKDIRKVGYQLLIKKPRNERSKDGNMTKVEKFRREGGLFDHPGLAAAHAKKYFSQFEYRTQGVRIDCTPIAFSAARSTDRK